MKLAPGSGQIGPENGDARSVGATFHLRQRLLEGVDHRPASLTRHMGLEPVGTQPAPGNLRKGLPGGLGLRASHDPCALTISHRNMHRKCQDALVYVYYIEIANKLSAHRRK